MAWFKDRGESRRKVKHEGTHEVEEQQVKPGDIVLLNAGGREFTVKVEAVRQDGGVIVIEGGLIAEW